MQYVTYILVPVSFTVLLAGILKASTLVASPAARDVLEMLVKTAARAAGLYILMVAVWLTLFVDSWAGKVRDWRHVRSFEALAEQRQRARGSV